MKKLLALVLVAKLLVLAALVSALTSCSVYRTPTGEQVGACKYKVSNSGHRRLGGPKFQL